VTRKDETLASEGVPPPSSGSVLLVVGAGHLSTHPLEPGKTLVIGRDEACDVSIDHPKVSRRHALVTGDATGARVEDAGGTNRVKLGDRTLASGESATLTPGASFQVGPFTVVLLGMPSPIGESAEGRAELVVRDVRTGALTDLIGRVAASDVSVLIRGETGSGKEVLANALHQVSKRSGPLLAINCASLNESLLESELFGHERGAFTGAVQAKPGLFEAAQGGTVFLDEIAELPASVQAKLLRAIETRQVMRLGGVKPIALDIRFLAATHRDLRDAVAEGEFRQDLYFRINGITILVVPLRDRKDTIPALAQEFIVDAAARARRAPPRLSPGALTSLARHDWPGNVRELKTVIERALLLTPGDEIAAKHIVLDTPAPARADDKPVDDSGGERDRIIAALDDCAGNQTRAAKQLGISRATLAHKLALFRIPRPRS
jgi:two-component system, NtrC family, response regulator AtoC